MAKIPISTLRQDDLVSVAVITKMCRPRMAPDQIEER